VTCSQASELLTAFVDGELTAAEKAAVEAHLAGCAVCQAQVASLRAAIGTLAALPALEPSPAFEEAVLAALRPTRTHRPHWARRAAVLLVAGGAVAAALVVVPKLGLRGASTSELAMAAELDLLQNYEAVDASDAVASAEDVEVVAALDQLMPASGDKR
jgi:anti-sigma factor RsiW